MGMIQKRPLLQGAGFTAYLKSSLKVKADGSYDYESATPVVIGENGAKSIYTDEKGHAVSIAIPYGTYGYLKQKHLNMETIKPFGGKDCGEQSNRASDLESFYRP